MGHMVGRDIYQDLGKKLDSLAMRAPYNEKLYEILKELYTPEQAELVVKIPDNLSDFSRLQKVTQLEKKELHRLLNAACSKGLIMDLFLNGQYYYLPSPLLIGVYEFTMMRMKGENDSKKIAGLFQEYLFDNRDFTQANFHQGIKISPMRTLPYEEAFLPSQFVEVLDYEKATQIVKSSQKFAISPCACRHEEDHLQTRQCNNPLDTCSSLDMTADYLIRHGFAQAVSKEEMLEKIARSKDLGLVFNADNVKNKVNFICHCCKCCCAVFKAMKIIQDRQILVSSDYLAKIDPQKCQKCGICLKYCPTKAITMNGDIASKSNKPITIDEKTCIGCGVCISKCPQKALRFEKRGRRLFHPQTTFERLVLQSLERGNLQNLIFDNSQSLSHQFMRGFMGAFLKLDPIKKTLMSEMFRSTFLSACKTGYKITGRQWMTEI